jgi:hypothetical protein
MKYTCKQYLGALVYDMPRYISSLYGKQAATGNREWVFIRNRKEKLFSAPDGMGVYCDWEWTSELYLPKVLPFLGKWLYHRAFGDFPVVFANHPAREGTGRCQVSFIIGHRGMKRLPLLLATLKSIAGQTDCCCECVVVEQDNDQLVRPHLPEWVRYIHTPLPDRNMDYCRSWAFNIGAKEARGDLLVLHDNDLLVPALYARDQYKLFCQGVEVVNLKRFIFYLDRKSSQQVCRQTGEVCTPVISTILQNAEGGGSIGISRQAFWDIGGFDEGFVGWGGEDNEFWERAQTRTVHPFGYFPLIHLWHAAQKGRNEQAECFNTFNEVIQQPVEERIIRLQSIKSGDLSGPVSS